MTEKKGRVFLIGAGPGDPKLLTLRGKECLEKAEVVVYDRLVHPRILSFANTGADFIFVGKSPAGHTKTQAEINSILVEIASGGRVVARLKGGDPFVFGRGGEEAEALVEAGIPFEVVPGVTSAIAVPAYAGIPVTHRDFTSTVAIITGNEDPSKDESDIAWDKIATGAGTLVFLMGMANLPVICERLIANGRNPLTPVAVIRWGTRAEQETVTGTLSTIDNEVAAKGLKNPAIIVVGEVTALRPRLQWFEKRPLFGKRVIVTRSRAQASVLTARLEDLGAEVYEFPTISIVPPDDLNPLDHAIGELGKYHWVIFTSVNGVKAFFSRLSIRGGDVRTLARAKVCAIGSETARALAQRGIVADYVPEEYRAEALLEGIEASGIKGQMVLLARAEVARDVLPEGLRQAGALVDDVTVYRTVLGDGDVGALRALLEEGRVDALTFTSSSTVKNFCSLLGPETPLLTSGTVVACIGPITAEIAWNQGLRVDVVAQEYTISGLVEALSEYWLGLTIA